MLKKLETTKMFFSAVEIVLFEGVDRNLIESHSKFNPIGEVEQLIYFNPRGFYIGH
jgi:hypothetical protein